MDTMDIYRPGCERRCWNGENATRERSRGGMGNHGAKGSAFAPLPAGQTAILLDARGAGAVDHIWLTFKTANRPLDPVLLRALRLDMFWDDSARPAVSVPLGDFFGVLPGVVADFETELFTFPRGAAFNTYVKMPFRTAARIKLTNTSDIDVTHLFYTVEYLLDPAMETADPPMYFHACWRREAPNTLGQDFVILPAISGRGRFLGCHLGIRTDPRYGGAWWGEGEVKTWLDGDGEFPSLIGTGAEDYLGTGWGLGEFRHRYQGCL
ncbi:MAG TPA: glycoside hydrolase family 172 protein, partial [Clostridia bacterium]